MRRILDILRRRRSRLPKCVRPLAPIQFQTNGGFQYSTETLARLEHLQTLGFLYREQVESAAAECCELLGIDPRSQAIEADWAKDIVLEATPVPVIIERIAQRKQELKAFLD